MSQKLSSKKLSVSETIVKQRSMKRKVFSTKPGNLKDQIACKESQRCQYSVYNRSNLKVYFLRLQ